MRLFMSQLRSLKRKYLTYLATEWGGSPKMVENYDRYLERFLTYTKVTTPAAITAERVAAFRLHLAKQPGAKIGNTVEPMKQQTQNYYLIALRMFLKYLQSQGYETISAQQVVLAKVPKRSIDLISSAELDRLRAAPDLRTLEGKRDKAILELLCSTGVRMSELCALSVGDINITRPELVISGSGNKNRSLFLSDAARQALGAYLKARTDIDTALFIRYGRKANNGGDLRIHPRAVQRMVKKYAAAVGITTVVTPHVIRHTFATDLLAHGADIKTLQVLLGHDCKTSTDLYTKTRVM